jgi:hypothetical protein
MRRHWFKIMFRYLFPKSAFGIICKGMPWHSHQP